jgi:hypothetical protein
MEQDTLTTKRSAEQHPGSPAKKPSLAIEASGQSPFSVLPIEIIIIILGYVVLHHQEHDCRTLDDYSTYPQGGLQCLIPFFEASSIPNSIFHRPHNVCTHYIKQFYRIKHTCKRFGRALGNLVPRLEIHNSEPSVHAPRCVGPVAYFLGKFPHGSANYAYFVRRESDETSRNPHIERINKALGPSPGLVVKQHLEMYVNDSRDLLVKYVESGFPLEVAVRGHAQRAAPGVRIAIAFKLAYGIAHWRRKERERLINARLFARGYSCKDP